jgi:hypothetical protein
MLKFGQAYIIDPLCKLFNNILKSTFLLFLFKLLKYLNHSFSGISSDGELELGLSI